MGLAMGFVRTDGTPVVHGQSIADLIEVMELPKELAIVKCAAHESNKILVSW